MDIKRLEDIIIRAGISNKLETLLPKGGRNRQLSVHSLILGLLISQVKNRCAHLTKVYEALVSLGPSERLRLGIEAKTKRGMHLLTYRQVEYTFCLLVKALSKDGLNNRDLVSEFSASLLDASIPDEYKEKSKSLAVDWSDLESYFCPPKKDDKSCVDPEASWGRRKSKAPGKKDELFYGYYIQCATMVKEENEKEFPEFTRRILITSAKTDPPRAFVKVLKDMRDMGIELGDILADIGYSNRAPETWALAIRDLGAQIVTDLHPFDRGPKGTFMGAVISNGSLYCPSCPKELLNLGPLSRSADKSQIKDHDAKTKELALFKLAPLALPDKDGFYRLRCPSVANKLKCPLRPDSLKLPNSVRLVSNPPSYQPPCCVQKTITVPVEITAKTYQKHDYPSAAHRESYKRRSAAERTFSTIKDKSSNDMTKGWCRIKGTCALMLFATATFVARNERIRIAFLTQKKYRGRKKRRTRIKDLISK